MSAREELQEFILNLSENEVDKIEQGIEKLSALLSDQTDERRCSIIVRLLKLSDEQFEQLLALYTQQEQAGQEQLSA